MSATYPTNQAARLAASSLRSHTEASVPNTRSLVHVTESNRLSRTRTIRSPRFFRAIIAKSDRVPNPIPHPKDVPTSAHPGGKRSS